MTDSEIAAKAASKQNRVVRVTLSPRYGDDNIIDYWRKIAIDRMRRSIPDQGWR